MTQGRCKKEKIGQDMATLGPDFNSRGSGRISASVSTIAQKQSNDDSSFGSCHLSKIIFPLPTIFTVGVGGGGKECVSSDAQPITAFGSNEMTDQTCNIHRKVSVALMLFKNIHKQVKVQKYPQPTTHIYIQSTAPPT